LSDGDDQILEAAITRVAEQARRAWSGVRLDTASFVAHLRGRGIDAAALDRHGPDLFLACACARGDDRATQILHRWILPALDRDLRRLGVAAHDLDDVRQSLLVRLLTAPNGGLASYSGRSALLTWLRTVATREAINQLRRIPPEKKERDHRGLEGLLAATADPEVTTIRGRLKADFQAALEEALAALSPQARNVLRLHYVEGQNIEAIGAIYSVHRATVARWIVATRAAVIARLRQRVQGTRAPTSSEFRSLTAAVREELHISVDRLLAR
jgi:RNA polymerase sigma-70 factor (ECF subfamily)